MIGKVVWQCCDSDPMWYIISLQMSIREGQEHGDQSKEGPVVEMQTVWCQHVSFRNKRMFLTPTWLDRP